MQISVDSLHEDAVIYGDDFFLSDCDATFTASCAGAAEAAWKSTVNVIDQCLKYPYAFQENSMNPCNDIASDIIAAWPEELL